VVFVTPHLFYSLTDGLSYLKGGGGWASYGLRILWLTLPCVLVPSLFAGMVLPLLMEMAGQSSDEPSGRVLGWLLGINTAAAIAGSLLAAFVLSAWLGMWASLVFVGITMIVAGDYCLGAAAGGLFVPRRIALVSLVAGGVLFWNPACVPRTKFLSNQGEKLLALQEGSHGIVAVVEKNNSRRLKLNNFYVLGGTASTGDERLQGHLPLLLHQAPKRVAFLGLGTGITAGAALFHPVDRVTAVEIAPEVITAARDYFAEANLGFTRSPRTELIAEDARDYLRGTRRGFDVIVGDLVVPWRQGEAALYTAEHFATVRRSLRPGGIFCQWLPLFQLAEEEFDIVAATFLDVFPHTSLWRGDFAPNEPALALTGHLEDVALDPAAVERRLRELKPDEANPSLLHPAGLWMFLVGPLDPKEERFVRARRNRENEPWLELLGPLNHAGSRRGGSPLFVGRRLETFLNELRARSLAGSMLARLDVSHARWRDAGAKVAMASILTAEGNPRGADSLLKQAVLMLPREIRSAFDSAVPQ
jgi:spermidine synthase